MSFWVVGLECRIITTGINFGTMIIIYFDHYSTLVVIHNQKSKGKDMTD